MYKMQECNYMFRRKVQGNYMCKRSICEKIHLAGTQAEAVNDMLQALVTVTLLRRC